VMVVTVDGLTRPDDTVVSDVDVTGMFINCSRDMSKRFPGVFGSAMTLLVDKLITRKRMRLTVMFKRLVCSARILCISFLCVPQKYQMFNPDDSLQYNVGRL
jgi:hypothetical protein